MKTSLSILSIALAFGAMTACGQGPAGGAREAAGAYESATQVEPSERAGERIDRRAEPAHARPTVIYFSAGADGDKMSIGEESIDLSQVRAATLRHAIADNPAIAVDDIPLHARIVLCSEADVRYGLVLDAMLRLKQQGFDNVTLEMAGSGCDLLSPRLKS